MNEPSLGAIPQTNNCKSIDVVWNTQVISQISNVMLQNFPTIGSKHELTTKMHLTKRKWQLCLGNEKTSISDNTERSGEKNRKFSLFEKRRKKKNALKLTVIDKRDGQSMKIGECVDYDRPANNDCSSLLHNTDKSSHDVATNNTKAKDPIGVLDLRSSIVESLQFASREACKQRKNNARTEDSRGALNRERSTGEGDSVSLSQATAYDCWCNSVAPMSYYPEWNYEHEQVPLCACRPRGMTAEEQEADEQHPSLPPHYAIDRNDKNSGVAGPGDWKFKASRAGLDNAQHDQVPMCACSRGMTAEEQEADEQHPSLPPHYAIVRNDKNSGVAGPRYREFNASRAGMDNAQHDQMPLCACFPRGMTTEEQEAHEQHPSLPPHYAIVRNDENSGVAGPGDWKFKASRAGLDNAQHDQVPLCACCPRGMTAEEQVADEQHPSLPPHYAIVRNDKNSGVAGARYREFNASRAGMNNAQHDQVPMCACSRGMTVDEQVATERLLNLPSQYSIVKDNASPGVALALDWEFNAFMAGLEYALVAQAPHLPSKRTNSSFYGLDSYIPDSRAPTVKQFCKCNKGQHAPRYPPPLARPYVQNVQPLRLLADLGPMQGPCGHAPFASPPYVPCSGPPTHIGQPIGPCPAHGPVAGRNVLIRIPRRERYSDQHPLWRRGSSASSPAYVG